MVVTTIAVRVPCSATTKRNKSTKQTNQFFRMIRPMHTKTVLAAAMLLAGVQVQAAQGPSSSAAPYLQGVAPGVEFTSILTTGDSVGGYRMAGSVPTTTAMARSRC
ncbi:MAG TPA: hypothetical protein PKC22_05445 [Rhodocyclaceae bacterium]|nr:hypothetical protein [Rhodocyclaceae bacterium]